MRFELQKAREQIKEAESAISAQSKEIEKLNQIISEADQERLRQTKEYDIVINERDILGTQLIRRNDELALLYEKIKIQASTLSKGQIQYRDRLNEIRVLKIKLSDVKRELLVVKNSVAAVDVLKETTKSVKRTATGVCLPSPEALTKIALIQTEASAAVDPAAAAKFAAEAKKLGGAVNPRNVLPLVPYVEPGGLLPRSFPADQLARFKKAGFALEAAQKQALKAQKGGGLSGMAVRGAPAS